MQKDVKKLICLNVLTKIVRLVKRTV